MVNKIKKNKWPKQESSWSWPVEDTTNNSVVPDEVSTFQTTNSDGDIVTVNGKEFDVEHGLKELIKDLEAEATDANHQSNHSLAQNREFYYMGVDSALTGVVGKLNSLLIKVITK